MRLLAIETSTSAGSIALFEGEELRTERKFLAGRGGGGVLFACLQELAPGLCAGDRIVIGLGPGSFAGTRVAIAAGIGLSVGTGAELCGLASSLAFAERDYTYIGDARRNAFHVTRVAGGKCVLAPTLVPVDEIAPFSEGAIFVSEPLPLFPAAAVAVPTAALFAAAIARFPEHLVTGPLEPLYLREAHITKAPGASTCTPV